MRNRKLNLFILNRLYYGIQTTLVISLGNVIKLGTGQLNLLKFVFNMIIRLVNKLPREIKEIDVNCHFNTVKIQQYKTY